MPERVGDLLDCMFGCILFSLKKIDGKVLGEVVGVGQKQKTKQVIMTEGVIWKQLLAFSMPLLVGNLFVVYFGLLFYGKRSKRIFRTSR